MAMDRGNGQVSHYALARKKLYPVKCTKYKGYLLCLTGIDVPCTVWILSLRLS